MIPVIAALLPKRHTLLTCARVSCGSCGCIIDVYYVCPYFRVVMIHHPYRIAIAMELTIQSENRVEKILHNSLHYFARGQCETNRSVVFYRIKWRLLQNKNDDSGFPQ